MFGEELIYIIYILLAFFMLLLGIILYDFFKKRYINKKFMIELNKREKIFNEEFKKDTDNIKSMISRMKYSDDYNDDEKNG